jgi:Sulfotransferase family
MSLDSRGLVLIMGSPRSGTTWLAKIFDSDRNVLYRHEPDSILKSPGLPFVPELEEIGGHLEQARAYLDAQRHLRAIKSSGSLPMFDKAYRGQVAERGRRLLASSTKLLEAGARRLNLRAHITIPDWIDDPRGVPPLTVLKSVDSLTRTRLFAEAVPEAKIIHIIRHPCAFVASELRGESLKVMQPDAFLSTQVKMRQAQRRGWDMDFLQQLSREQQLASLWMLQNEKVMEEMSGHTNYRVIVYEDLCRSPLPSTRALFEFCGLELGPQTEAFIDLSLNYRGGRSERYFQIVRDPMKAAFKWRDELLPAQIDAIMTLVGDSLPGALYRRAERCSGEVRDSDAQPA